MSSENWDFAADEELYQPQKQNRFPPLTRNVSEFSRVSGLKVEDYTKTGQSA